MDFPVQPVGDHIIIKRIPAETVSLGGIVIPEVSREKPRRGFVLAVGPGEILPSGERNTIPLEPGDTIVYERDYGTEVMVGAVELTILRHSEVIAKEIG